MHISHSVIMFKMQDKKLVGYLNLVNMADVRMFLIHDIVLRSDN